MATRAAPQPIQFSGNASYTNTVSAVASDGVDVSFAQTATIYALYTPAGATKLAYTVEINPYDATTDAAGAYWSRVGIYVDVAGVWTEEKAEYQSATGANGVPQVTVPLTLTNLNASRLRVTSKDSATGGGVVRFVITKNSNN